MHGRIYARAHAQTRARARGGTHYAHMTAPNQKTKTITQSIVSHLAFDLRTSIGTFSLQNRACSIYRWHNRLTHSGSREALISLLYKLIIDREVRLRTQTLRNQHKQWETRSLTWSARLVEDPESSSWSDFELPSRSSITRSIGIFPFKQLMYRWQKLSQSSCT